MSQLELFSQPTVGVSSVPSVEDVRRRLEAVLRTLRSASEVPWPPRETARLRLTVPQMADWLPADERDAVRGEFSALLAGLEARAA